MYQISDLASNPHYQIMKLESRLEPTILDPESNLKLYNIKHRVFVPGSSLDTTQSRLEPKIRDAI